MSNPDAFAIEPPIFGTVTLVNDGSTIFANQFANIFIAAYSSIHHPDDNIGNYSHDGITWTPVANNTDPPSHFVITIKDFTGDCNFYPSFDLYNNMFAMAWLESNPVGRLNLKYAESIVHNPPTTVPLPNQTTYTARQNVYIYPNALNAAQNVQTENVPMNDIQIVDINDNVFNLDIFTNPNNRGYQLAMPAPVKALRFGQVFRQAQILMGFIGSALQANTTLSIPLANIDVTIYYGKTQLVYQRVSTDASGAFTVPVKPGKYTFEITINTLSINYSQKLV